VLELQAPLPEALARVVDALAAPGA
jgi:hypothetical protein